MKIENYSQNNNENKIIVLNYKGVQVPQPILDVEIKIDGKKAQLKNAFEMLENENKKLENEIVELKNEIKALKICFGETIEILQKEINKKGTI